MAEIVRYQLLGCVGILVLVADAIDLRRKKRFETTFERILLNNLFPNLHGVIVLIVLDRCRDFAEPARVYSQGTVYR